jgi:hypothetical protein
VSGFIRLNHLGRSQEWLPARARFIDASMRLTRGSPVTASTRISQKTAP